MSVDVPKGLVRAQSARGYRIDFPARTPYDPQYTRVVTLANQHACSIEPFISSRASVRHYATIRRQRHSEKPPEFQALIERLYPFGRRVELFARGRVPAPWVG